jgi:hypothetical protein
MVSLYCAFSIFVMYISPILKTLSNVHYTIDCENLRCLGLFCKFFWMGIAS